MIQTMMILGTLKDLDEVHIGNWELNARVHDYLEILDSNYGSDRNVYEDDGGFAIIVENEADLRESTEYFNMDTDIYEYLEEINEHYISMLKLCNNEFSIMIYIRKVLCSDEVLEQLYGNDESGRE